MVDQASASHGLSVLVDIRRNHFAKFLHPAILEGQKNSLFSSPIFSADLIDQSVCKRVLEEFSGDAVTSGNLSITSWFAQGFLKRKVSEASSVAGLAAAVGAAASPVVPPGASSSSTPAPPPAKAPEKTYYRGKKGKGQGKGKPAQTPASQKQDLPK